MEYVDEVPMEFITGYDPNLKYESILGSGGYGRVYQVRYPHSASLIVGGSCESFIAEK